MRSNFSSNGNPSGPMPPSLILPSNPLVDKFPPVAATAKGLMSHPLTIQPMYDASTQSAPEPHPISRNFLPLPGPNAIILLANKLVSSLGGYTVEGTIRVKLKSLTGDQSIVLGGRCSLSTSSTASSAVNTSRSAMRLNPPFVPKPLCLLAIRAVCSRTPPSPPLSCAFRASILLAEDLRTPCRSARKPNAYTWACSLVR